MNRQSNLLVLSNLARASAGALPLQTNAILERVAQNHAEAMALEGYFDHIDNRGRSVGERLLAAGYNYRWCGENISAGKAFAEDVMQWWLESSAHRANILKTEFTETGFGYCFIEYDKNAFHHYWVQVLGGLFVVT
jgi:uncharacterized protein YkwD